MKDGKNDNLVFNPNDSNMYYYFFSGLELPKESKHIFTGNKVVMEPYTHYFFEINHIESNISVYDGYDLVESNVIPGNKLIYTRRMSDELMGDFKKGVRCHLTGEPGIQNVYVNTVAVEVEEYIHNWTDEISYPFPGKPVIRENSIINREKIKLKKKYNTLKIK